MVRVWLHGTSHRSYNCVASNLPFTCCTQKQQSLETVVPPGDNRTQLEVGYFWLSALVNWVSSSSLFACLLHSVVDRLLCKSCSLPASVWHAVHAVHLVHMAHLAWQSVLHLKKLHIRMGGGGCKAIFEQEYYKLVLFCFLACSVTFVRYW